MKFASHVAITSISVSMFAPLAACSGSDPSSDPSGVGGSTNPAAFGGNVGIGNGGSAGTRTSGTTNGSGAEGGAKSNSTTSTTAGGTTSVAGAPGTGGSTSSGGSVATGGSIAAGGSIVMGGASTLGGATNVGGVSTKGGSSSSGGTTAKGGTSATGGITSTGGTSSKGGSSATGGGSSCPVELVGFASVNADGINGTTGGGNATPVTVTTFAQLKAAAQDSAARVIVVSGTIKTTDGGGSAMSVASNKTIIGANKSATIYGGIVLNGVSNVIVRNLNIQGVYPNSGPDDTLASHNSHHVWYDHLAIWDAGDGLLDITNQSNYHTVSWTKFYYTNSANGHRLASLNGSGGGDHPEDSRYLKSTYHHNWWSTLVNERMPRMMYGKLHAFNNYYNAPNNAYCIGVGSFGTALIENNYFKSVKSPHIFMYDWHMYIAASGNVYDNTTGNKDTGMSGSRGTNDPALNAGVEDAAAFTPPYKYTLDKAADVPALVQKCAGPQ
ncbi:MAG: hypothetical protein QM784_20750 [Polyangiaceae bacterium]